MRNLSSAVGQSTSAQNQNDHTDQMFTVHGGDGVLTTQDEAACIVLDTLSLPFFPPEIFFSHLSLWYSWSRLLWNTLEKFLHKPFTGPDPITSPCTTLTNMYVNCVWVGGVLGCVNMPLATDVCQIWVWVFSFWLNLNKASIIDQNWRSVALQRPERIAADELGGTPKTFLWNDDSNFRLVLCV